MHPQLLNLGEGRPPRPMPPMNAATREGLAASLKRLPAQITPHTRALQSASNRPPLSFLFQSGVQEGMQNALYPILGILQLSLAFPTASGGMSLGPNMFSLFLQMVNELWSFPPIIP